jgi:hypothetical protein
MSQTQSNYNALSCLNLRRLPARLNPEQVAQVTGFQTHDIPMLVKAGLLKPLGGGPRNSVKFFAAFEVEAVCCDRKWLDRATKAISRRSRSSSNEILKPAVEGGDHD